jgi:hypothetical protein
MLINKEANLRQPSQIAHRDKVCWGFRVQRAKLKPANTYTMIPTATARYETGLLSYLSIYKDERINLRQPGLHNRNTSQIKTHKLIQQMMKESISPSQLFQFPFTIIQTEMSVCKWLEVLLMTSNCVRLPLSSVPASKGFIFLQSLIDIDNKDK